MTNSSDTAQRFVIGRSVRGRRIVAYRVGPARAAKRLLVVGCIHGNEPAGIAVAHMLQQIVPPPGTAVWIVPVLNPDGVVAHTRQNADQVDLNRNFPWHWTHLGSLGDLQFSGSHPLSEPEARAARALILLARPQTTIWFHQPLDVVDFSGGDPAVERRFAKLTEMRTEMLTRYPGSAVSWENSVLPGSTAFVVELPPGALSPASVTRYARAIETLATRRVPSA